MQKFRISDPPKKTGIKKFRISDPPKNTGKYSEFLIPPIRKARFRMSDTLRTQAKIQNF